MEEESLKRLMEAFKAAKISYAYNKIPTDDDSPKLPYVTAIVRGGQGVNADNSNYYDTMNISLTLFTKKKEPAMEDRVKTVLHSLDLVFSWSENFVETDKVYEITYSFEMEA